MNSWLLRDAIRQILQEEAGPSKPLELVKRMENINRRILDKHIGKRLDRDQAPIFGVSMRTQGDPMLISFAVSGIDEDGELIPGSITPIDDSDTALSMAKYLGGIMPYGSIEFRRQESPCLQAMSVSQTNDTMTGWGPLLYDLAIETATQIAGGLTSDREIVSGDARSVWGKYDTARGDVEKLQLDINDDPDQTRALVDEEDLAHLTPETDDDCLQTSAIRDVRGISWFKSPLSRAYRKPPVITSMLDSLGFLFRE